MHILLASQSPRRRALIQYLGVPFTCVPTETNEGAIAARCLQEYRASGASDFDAFCQSLVQSLALAKAEAVPTEQIGAEVTHILSADTIVVLGEEILGKPVNKEEAVSMLRRLAGQVHTVYTGVCIKTRETCSCFTVPAQVEFYPLDGYMENFIVAYGESGSPLDKAGAYGIQDQGALLVRRIEGDVHTVIGFPIAEIARRLAAEKNEVKMGAERP